jgi:phosphohistidine phosphatase
MELYLMQHGQAVTEEEDPERPLSREGIAQIQASAAAIRRLGLTFGVIVCSPKRRSKQTAALIAEAVRYPYSDLVTTDLVLPSVPAVDTLRFLEQYRENGSVLVTGHLPSLGEIASALLAGVPVGIRFDNGGLCRLDLQDSPSMEAELHWYVPAALMRLLAGE